MQMSEKTEESLNIIRQKGALLALDDFGSGFSNLYRLKQVCTDIIKIDKMFIKNAGKDRVFRRFLETIIAVSKEIKASIIAEGVETNEELKPAREVGCDYVQGFLLCEPLPPENLFEKCLADSACFS